MFSKTIVSGTSSMYNDVGLLQTDVIMFIYLQKYHHIFSNINFWFNRHYINDVEALFFLLVLQFFLTIQPNCMSI